MPTILKRDITKKTHVFEINSKITHKRLFFHFSWIFPEFTNSPPNFKDAFDFVKKKTNICGSVRKNGDAELEFDNMESKRYNKNCEWSDSMRF